MTRAERERWASRSWTITWALCAIASAYVPLGLLTGEQWAATSIAIVGGYHTQRVLRDRTSEPKA